MNALPEYVSPVPAVVVAPEDIRPLTSAYSPPADRETRVSLPALLNDDVAVVPKYAYPAERPVVEALASNLIRDVVAEIPAAG